MSSPAQSAYVPAQIRVVRYQIGLSYIPLTYDDNIEGVVYTSAAGMTQFPSTWRIMEGRIYFNPALGVGGEKYLQIEYFSYPERFLTDGQQIPKEFDTSLQNFIKYRAASILAATAKASLSADAVIVPTCVATPFKMTAAGKINVTIATGPLTAGVIEVWVLYTTAAA